MNAQMSHIDRPDADRGRKYSHPLQWFSPFTPTASRTLAESLYQRRAAIHRSLQLNVETGWLCFEWRSRKRREIVASERVHHGGKGRRRQHFHRGTPGIEMPGHFKMPRSGKANDHRSVRKIF